MGLEGLLSILTSAKLILFKPKNEEKNNMCWKVWVCWVRQTLSKTLQVGHKKANFIDHTTFGVWRVLKAPHKAV